MSIGKTPVLFILIAKEDFDMSEIYDTNPELELEMEGDERPADMEDRILTRGKDGKAIAVIVDDDPEPEENTEDANDAEDD